jgi:hypothetical protein
MATGAFRVWTVDDNGNWISTEKKSDADKPLPDPASEKAVDIYFAPVGVPPDDQSKLYDDITYVLDVVRRLYLPDGTRPNKQKFRAYFVRIFRLTQVGLQGDDASPKQAKSALDSIKASLLDDEGLRIKTRNLSALAEMAMTLSIPLLVVYFVLCVTGKGDIDRLFEALKLSRATTANFMLLWVGCFVGVCLSYGIRTATLSLADLVSAGPDRLPPGTRLLFIGTLTMLFGLLFCYGIVEVKIGSHSSASIASDPGLAFIIGILFGLSEAKLPGLAGSRAEGFVKGLQ